jgi:hypothetical protein
MRFTAIFLIATGAVCACSSTSAATSEPHVLCDGTDELALAILLDGQLGRRPSHSGVLYELGQPFLYVNGACHYWVSSWNSDDALQEWRPWLTGELDDAERHMLSELVTPSKLDALLPSCRRSPSGDQPSVGFANSMRSLWCTNQDGLVGETWNNAAEIARTLHERGTETSDGIRVLVGTDGTGPVTNVPPYAWPLAQPIDDFVGDSTDPAKMGSGGSFLVTDHASTAALRSLRNDFLRDQELQKGGREPGIQIEGGYTVYLREAFALNDQQGLVTLP